MTSRHQVYVGATTAGTALASGTTGLRLPDDMAGIIAIGADGADGEYLDVQFEKNTHRFGLEQVPTFSEIAVNTRVKRFQFAPCYWRLGKGEGIKITPRGGESSDVKAIHIIWGDDEELSKGQGIHWIHCDQVTHGTTADGTKIADIPEECTVLVKCANHGAGTTVLGIRLKPGGVEENFPSNHGSTNAAEDPVTIHNCNIPKQSDIVTFVVNSNYFTGTGTLEIYLGWLYA